MKNTCERIISEKSKDLLLEYITRNFDSIMPLRITKGCKFQIRFSKSEFDDLSDNNIKETLAKCVNSDETKRLRVENKDKYDEVMMRDFYWDRCDSYIFSYESKNSYMLEIKDRWIGYRDLGEREVIYFIDQNEFPKCIIDNFEKWEDDDFVS